ncbi:MAG: 7,8-didemethyl-8-hydroxy-5-deazariboflavin synthase subunit CofG [Synechococcales cyanobacterium T60_A2020_003]|nr:7,8-didemethyl-8-hydroxy-5-deazariboflavin synthase subunit CofG [Synechococcales cyanobacterium T60_A2020_003]
MESLVTYSPSFTLVPTYECFNRCSYCNFRIEPGNGQWLDLEAAQSLLEAVKQQGVIEILILSGEVHPRHSQRAAWFQHIYKLCTLAIDLGFLPHTNVGPLSYEELSQLKQVNASMGLMVEQVTSKLMQTVHRHAPSKIPEVRLQQLEWAGRLKIPFTTGLLLGIGETEADWQETLEAIAQSHTRWGHIQEVILQPHSPGQQQELDAPSFPSHRLPEVVRLAREILPWDVTIQIPPNLVNEPETMLACLRAGVRDLGGIGPVDEVNPDYPHPTPQRIRELIGIEGWILRPRLPVYAHYDDWLPAPMQQRVRDWRSRLEYAQSS